MKAENYKSAMEKQSPSYELTSATLARMREVRPAKKSIAALKYVVGAVGLAAACAAMVFGAAMLNGAMSKIDTQTEESLVITLSESENAVIADGDNTLTEGRIFADENGISIVPRASLKLTTTDGKMQLNEKTTVDDCIAAGVPVYMPRGDDRIGYINTAVTTSGSFVLLNSCINIEPVYRFFSEAKQGNPADIVICVPSGRFTQYVYFAYRMNSGSEASSEVMRVYTYSDTQCLSIVNYEDSCFCYFNLNDLDYTGTAYSSFDKYFFLEIKKAINSISAGLLDKNVDISIVRNDVALGYTAPLRLDGQYYNSYIMGYFIERCKQESNITCQAYEFDLDDRYAAAYTLEYVNGKYFIESYNTDNAFQSTECDDYMIDNDKITFTGNDGKLYEFGYEYCDEEMLAQSDYDPSSLNRGYERLFGVNVRSYDEIKRLTTLQRIKNYYDNQQPDTRIVIFPEELRIDVTLPLDYKYLLNGWHFDSERLPADEGSAVYSIADGAVIYANEYGPFTDGTTVIIEHANGYASRYSGCGTVLVQSGQSVKKGDIIATVGTDNIMTEPYETHLSFDIYRNGYSISMPDHIGISAVYDYLALREKGDCKYDKLIDYVNFVTAGEQIITPEDYAQIITQ